MKYKVIAPTNDGWIVANKSNILAVRHLENSDGDIMDPQEGDIVSDKTFARSDIYWCYTRKEWDKISKEFKKVK